jgi:hypothetical protein
MWNRPGEGIPLLDAHQLGLGASSRPSLAAISWRRVQLLIVSIVVVLATGNGGRTAVAVRLPAPGASGDRS